ncbi:TPA: ParA family protein [Candidatus Woesearchaeota archaeon]|nr:ParA family protein [Candidatus Woesearchaeota archaeon]
MVYCSEAIVPVSTDPLGKDALEKMILVVQKINEVFDHDLIVSKIVPTMHDTRTKTSKGILNEIQSEFYQTVTDPIRMNSKLREGAARHKPVLKYARSSNGGKDYAKLVKVVMRDEKKYGLTPIIEMNGRKAEEQEA